MKGGGILGILGGTLGAALLSKGMQAGGAAILGSVLKTAAGATLGKSGGRGGKGGLGESMLRSAFVSGKGRGKGTSGRGVEKGASRGSGQGAHAQDAPSLATLVEKTMEALASRETRPAEVFFEDKVRPIESESAQRREQALRLLEEATVSAVPGRVRLRHPAFREPALQALRPALLAAGMSEAVFNAKTGSILLTYGADAFSGDELFAVLLPLGEFLLDWQG